MAAEVQDSNLQKVDSAISDEPGSPSDVKKTTHRRTSSTVSSAANIADLGDWANIPLSMKLVLTRRPQRRKAWSSGSLPRHRSSTGKSCLPHFIVAYIPSSRLRSSLVEQEAKPVTGYHR